jgi:hypothetical protein
VPRGEIFEREQAQNSLILLASDSRKSGGFFDTPFEVACPQGIPAECRHRPARFHETRDEVMIRDQCSRTEAMMKARKESEPGFAAFQAV